MRIVPPQLIASRSGYRKPYRLYARHGAMPGKGTLLAFRLASYDKARASDLVKRLYGQRTSSHGGKYVYWRKGLLDEIPYVRLIRGVVIVRTEDAGRVLDLLGKFGTEVHARTVDLTREDREILGSLAGATRGTGPHPSG